MKEDHQHNVMVSDRYFRYWDPTNNKAGLSLSFPQPSIFLTEFFRYEYEHPVTKTHMNFTEFESNFLENEEVEQQKLIYLQRSSAFCNPSIESFHLTKQLSCLCANNSELVMEMGQQIIADFKELRWELAEVNIASVLLALCAVKFIAVWE
jgi:hypothetical protein